jgi:squalene synthase HpnC
VAKTAASAIIVTVNDAAVPDTSPPRPAVPSADDVLSQARNENFPVASRLLPAAKRRHLIAIYGFARLTDDIGDEADGDRLALLDWLEHELDRAAAGTATDPVLRQLTPTIRAFDLPLDPFRDLIDANRRDQVVHRYETFDELVGYCMLSAAPVGRLVLMILGLATPERIALADDVCVGLQLVEHLQDVAEDVAADRIYLPHDDLARAGCDDADLRAGQANDAVRAVVAIEIGRARPLLAAGAPLARTLPLRPRFAVAGFAAGGLAALDAIERAGNDVLAVRCRPRPRRVAVRLVGTLAGRTGRSTRTVGPSRNQPPTGDTP